VALAFTKTFDGEYVALGFLKMKVTEDSITQVINIPTFGERWFKKPTPTKADYNQFFQPNF